MAKRPIITLPDPMLRAPSAVIERVDQDLQRLIDDMLETMYAAPGIGLAAVQVAVPRRVLVFDITRDETAPKAPHAMINPEIVAKGEALRVHEEGCLSIPEFYAEVERPADITVRYLDRTGAQREERFEGVLATVIQHEVDHLNGVLFIDYLSRLKRDMVVRRFVKAKRSEGLV